MHSLGDHSCCFVLQQAWPRSTKQPSQLAHSSPDHAKHPKHVASECTECTGAASPWQKENHPAGWQEEAKEVTNA